MRTFLLCQLLLWPLGITNSYCQITNASVIEPLPLEVATDQTTHLIFPFSIKTVDRGSKDLLAQKASGVENILQVKAASAGLHPTNLTVITADGKLFSFAVAYSAAPHRLTILLSPPAEQLASLSTGAFNEAEVAAAAESAFNADNDTLIKDRCSKAQLTLSGLYIQNRLLVYKIELSNSSSIPYDIENFRFFIKDSKTPKRTAIQEREIKPLYIRGDTTVVAAHGSRSFIYVLPKMTIPDQKYLAIQMQEKNGGRHLKLGIRNKHILRATPIKQQ